MLICFAVDLQFILIGMHKKTQRPNYALASSSISDIPFTIGQKDLQFTNKNDALDYKQNSSIYQAFNQSRSRIDEGSSLRFSTARPFYEDLAEDYYDRPQNEEKATFNMQQKNDYNKERIKSKKSPNKKIMIFSYSNIVLFNKRLQKIIQQVKKRTFYTLHKITKQTQPTQPHKHKLSQYSGQTNNTTHDEAYFKMGYAARKPALRKQLLEAASIIEGWLQYRNLIEKRVAYNQIHECASQRKRFSLSLSQSLKIENTHQQNYFLTDYNHSNQISLSNGLPQPIQESLVYTLEHNNQSTRKEFTQSTLQKFPTLKHYPSSIKDKVVQHEMESEASIQNSPVYRLKSLKGSGQTSNEQTLKSLPVELNKQVLKNNIIKGQKLMEKPMEKGFEVQMKETKGIEHITSNDNIRINLSSTDQHDYQDLTLNCFQMPQQHQPIQHSGKYSDVSNYRMDNTVHNKQDQAYHLKINYVPNHPAHDQTVLKMNTMSQSHQTPSKIQRYYLSPNDIQMTPHFAPSEIKHVPPSIKPDPQREKLVSQLENDRIRIFNKPRPSQLNINSRENLIKSSFHPMNQLKTNVSASPNHGNHMAANSPIVINDRRFFSPTLQSDRNIRPFMNNFKQMPQPTSLKVLQPIKSDRLQNMIGPHKHPIFVSPQRDMRIMQKPIQQPLQIVNQQKRTNTIQYAPNPQQSLPHPPPQHLIHQSKVQVNQIKRLSPQTQNIRRPNFIVQQKPTNIVISHNPSKQRHIGNIQIQDYGFNQNIPKQKPHYALRQTLSPPSNQMPKATNEYQLTAQRRYISPLKKTPVDPSKQLMLGPAQLPNRQVLRAKSSASSPKLFFNYQKEQHLLEEMVVHSNMTKNSSQISRPKSMNSKLYVTLRKQQ